MKVVFRVDASVWIGSGHVMRCLVLADELKLSGFKVSFSCLPQRGDMISFIQSRGFNVIELTPLSEFIEPTHDSDYSSWLQRTEVEDAVDFLNYVNTTDIVVTDHYAISCEWQNIVRSNLDCYIVAIDDLVRNHYADLVIDQTLGRGSNEYQRCVRALTGSDYALLSHNFLELRIFAINRSPPSSIPRVLISMGGVDNPNATLAVLNALIGNVHAKFTVLLSPRAPHYKKVRDFCLKHDDIDHKDFESNMAELMLLHDIAIGAPGTTSWERACLGLPSILIPLAENQLTICSRLLAHNAIIKVELPKVDTQLLAAYEQVVHDWEILSVNNLRLCDGLGVRRVALEIKQMINPNTFGKLRIRTADQLDIETVYRWQCHPKTREFSLNSKIPSWPEHKEWMEKKLNSVLDFFYIVIDAENNKPLGVIRLDHMEHEDYLVSIYVDPSCYGKGVAIAALNMVDEVHPDITIHATVLEDNYASQRLFQKANYKKINSEKFIRYPF